MGGDREKLARAMWDAGQAAMVSEGGETLPFGTLGVELGEWWQVVADAALAYLAEPTEGGAS